MLDELLSRIGTPGLILAFMVVAGIQIRDLRESVRDLWSLVNGENGHAKQIERLKAKLEDIGR